uniref:Uncharacterized protein n=1 Tax=Panagrolaimus sp. ES5 TaxID=591445 RepID=A0AC34GCK2_9BILA
MGDKVGTKRKSFAEYYGPSKIAKKSINEKSTLTNFKHLLAKPLGEQLKERLILRFLKPGELQDLSSIDNKPLNIGLYDINGITVETITWNASDKMRIISKLKDCDGTQNAIVIEKWKWRLNKSTFKHLFQIHNKIGLDYSYVTTIELSDLESSSIVPFKLESCIERLVADRCSLILETAHLTVAKEAVYFYGIYNGIVVSDGRHFGIIAVKLDPTGNTYTKFDFKCDNVFKLKMTNTKLMDVPHYNLQNDVIEHFMIQNLNNVPVFYVDEKTIIETIDGVGGDLLGEREIGDLAYPHQHDDNFPLSDHFKKMKIE